MRLSERTTNVIVGLVALTLAGGLTTIGVKAAFGEFADTYELEGRFTEAGQGLIGGTDGSDVKVRGVNIGKVTHIELEKGVARVTMAIQSDERVPQSAKAIIRPKTLFGEKYVDIQPGDGEGSGPWLAENDEIRETLGGFELERVLAEAYPILLAIDPAELTTVLGTLADGGEGLGPVINRQIADFRRVADVWAAHDVDTRRFLRDFAELVDELALRSQDLVDGSRDLNVALPELNSRADSFASILDDTARLSRDLADLFDSNRGFLRASVTDGSRSLQVLYEERARIQPLLDGLRMYLQTVAEAAHIPLGDGTFLAAVKSIGGGEPCGRREAGCFSAGEPEGAPPAAAASQPPLPPLPPLPFPVPEAELPELDPSTVIAEPSTGSQAVIDLIEGTLQ